MVQLVQLITLDLKTVEKHGDLAGAWDGIMVLFRMARHFSEAAGLAQYLSGLSLEQMCAGLAMEWVVEHGQTPERLLAALTAYRELPKIPPPAEAVRAEANFAENTLDLPSDTFRDWLYESLYGKQRTPAQQGMDTLLLDVMTTPWEAARARRVNRLVSLAVIRETAREPWQRPRHIDAAVSHAEKSTRLAMMLIPNVSRMSPMTTSMRWCARARAGIRHPHLAAPARRPVSRAPRIIGAGGIAQSSRRPLFRPLVWLRPLERDKSVAPLGSALSASLGKEQPAAKGSWLLLQRRPRRPGRRRNCLQETRPSDSARSARRYRVCNSLRRRRRCGAKTRIAVKTPPGTQPLQRHQA